MEIEVKGASALSVERVGQIVNLWRETFGDDEDFVRYFLRYHDADDGAVYMALEGDELCAMFFTFDVTVGELYGSYVYAAATAPSYRGRGLFSALLERLEDFGGDFVTLIPASDELYDFYARRGFGVTLHSRFPFECKMSELLRYGRIDASPDMETLYAEHCEHTARRHDFTRGRALFTLSVEGLTVVRFDDGGYAAVKIENESSDDIKVYEMYSQSDEICGIINRYGGCKKRLGMMKMLGGKAAPHDPPEMTLFLQ